MVPLEKKSFNWSYHESWNKFQTTRPVEKYMWHIAKKLVQTKDHEYARQIIVVFWF